MRFLFGLASRFHVLSYSNARASNVQAKEKEEKKKEQNRTEQKDKKEGREVNTGNHASFSYSLICSEIMWHAGTERAAERLSLTAKTALKPEDTSTEIRIHFLLAQYRTWERHTECAALLTHIVNLTHDTLRNQNHVLGMR